MKRFLLFSMIFVACFYTESMSYIIGCHNPIFNAIDGERVCTGAYDCQAVPVKGIDDGGYWYDFDDQKEGGNSKVTYPVEADEKGSYVTPMIENLGVISITMTAGPDADYPFVGYGFNLVNSKKDGYDIGSNWGSGLCICISNTAKIELELEAADGIDTKDDHYNITIPAATVGRAVNLAWADFEQAGWGAPVAQKLVLASTAAIKLTFRGTQGKTLTNDVVISEIGIMTTQSLEKEWSSSVKAQFTNRTLFLENITSIVDVEVINLQGQTVMKRKLDKTSIVDLSDLDEGVYMVRVTGNALNFVKKILLK